MKNINLLILSVPHVVTKTSSSFVIMYYFTPVAVLIPPKHKLYIYDCNLARNISVCSSFLCLCIKLHNHIKLNSLVN